MIPLDKVIVDNWGRERIIPAMGVMDVDITLLKLLLLVVLYKFVQKGLLHFNTHHILWNILIFAESNHIGNDSAHRGKVCYISQP